MPQSMKNAETVSHHLPAMTKMVHSVASVFQMDRGRTDEIACLPLDMKGELTKELIQKAEVELGETPKCRVQAINALRALIKVSCKHWRTEDEVLLMFLRARKFDAQRAFQLMSNFYDYKENYYDRLPLSLDSVISEIERDYFRLMPYRDPQGRIIIMVDIAKYDPDRISVPNMLNLTVAFASKVMEEPATQIAGLNMILDCKNVNWKHLKCLSPTNSQLVVYTFQNSFPARYKECHILNVNVIVKMAYKILKIFIYKKLRDRIHFHTSSDFSSLHHYIPPSLLPPALGGTLECKERGISHKDVTTAKLVA